MIEEKESRLQVDGDQFVFKRCGFNHPRRAEWKATNLEEAYKELLARGIWMRVKIEPGMFFTIASGALGEGELRDPEDEGGPDSLTIEPDRIMHASVEANSAGS